MPSSGLTTGVLIDTGPLVAMLSADDQHHASCVAAARSLSGPFFTIRPVVTEAAYLLRHRPAAVDTLLSRLAMRELQLVNLTSNDVAPIRTIATRYSDQGFDLADSALMYVAERDDIRMVFTVDRRHFSMFRTKQGGTLTIYPQVEDG